MKFPSIHPHANLETLFGELMTALEKAREAKSAGELLKPVPVVVPSFHFTGWLQVAIARRNGFCMGLEFLMPQEFIGRALGLADPEDINGNNPWSKENLTWRILPHIGEYARELGVQNPSSRDRLALAGLLADQLDQYGHFRPGIIMKWARGNSVAKSGWSPPDRENEKWQRELWRKLQSEIDKSPGRRPHPALWLDELAASEDFLKILRIAFPQLFVVGTGALDPLLVRMLQLLGKAGCDVQASLALPSLGYLGEMRKSPRNIAQDPEELVMGDGHPLLVSMGRHAVGSFLLLGELDENYTHWPEFIAEPEPSAPSSLLGCLQSDIRRIRRPAGTHVYKKGDSSLRVHSCFGPRREMEVLRDELLRAFRDIPGLKPEEVIVAAPSLEIYAPLVAAVLGQSPALPVRLTELPPSEQNPAAEGLLALLEMTGGRHEASALLELLHLRAVRACLGISDDASGLERLRDWIHQSGLTQGLDAGRENSPVVPGSWSFARDRMIAGKWFGAEADAKYPGGDFVLPAVEELGGDIALKQAFLKWHWHLERTLREWRNEAAPGEWSARLGDACDQLLSSPDDEDSRMEIQFALNFLSQLDCAEPVEAAAIFDWLQGVCAESGRRTPVSGRITFGRLKQLQNIPCRVLAMVGMQEGAFPRQNRLPAWDLLHLEPRAWDRNARIDDRQLFLDAVLNPSDRLIITASTRNVRSGKSEPFSACVDELLRVAEATVTDNGSPLAGSLRVEHRLQPFAPGYFRTNADSDALPLSFDSNSAKVAESVLKNARDSRPDAPFWNPEAPCVELNPDGETREISLDKLTKFWRDPAWAFLKAQGIILEGDESDDAALDRAPLRLEGLQDWSAKSALINDLVAGGLPPGYTRALLAANRGLPLSELGGQTWDALHDKVAPLAKKISECIAGDLSLDFLVPGIMPPVRITGTLQRANLHGESMLLAYRPGTFKTRYYLQPWIHALAAACAGNSLRSCILDEKNMDTPEVFGFYDPELAAEQLRHLIDGFAQGQSRPLCYAPETSSVYAKTCRQWEDAPDEKALGKAASEWNREPYQNRPGGEGETAAAALAWRDQDPFAHKELWHQWARDVARPLQAWLKPN